MLRHDDHEAGASALTIALALVVIMGMAAIAIDAAGFGFNERRQSQTAADVSVMAGALEFQDEDDIVIQVLDFAKRNLRQEYDDSLGEWQALWEGCVDADRPVDFEPLDPPSGWSVVDPANWCISQSPSFLRVRMPDQLVETTFGRIIGFDTIRTSATAVATLQPSGSLNGLMPFAVRGGEGAGEICMQTGPSGISVPPCAGPSSGGFGTILSHWFGNDFYSTTPNCSQNQLEGSNNSTSILDDNVAIGIDHVIGTFDGDWDGDDTVDWTYPWSGGENNNQIANSAANVDDCSVSGGIAVPTDSVPLDTVLLSSGNDARDDVTRGLLANETYADGGTSRLQRGTNSKTTLRSGSSDWVVDNRPLWDYLLNAGDTTDDGTVAYDDNYAPTSCAPSSFPAALDLYVPGPSNDNNDQMATCLQEHLTQGGSVIFKDLASDSIADSPRFGWAPQLWHDDISGNKWRPVYQYRMVYLAGTFFNCSGTTCGLMFYAGDPGPTPLCDPGPPSCKSLVVNQTTAFLLPDAAIPTPIQDSFPIQNLGPFQPRLWR